jgi:hypothetical protein
MSTITPLHRHNFLDSQACRFREKIYILNTRGEPIEYFQPTDLEKCYHLEKGTRTLDEELIVVSSSSKNIFKVWYKSKNIFNTRPSKVSHHNTEVSISILGGYVVHTIQRINASTFTLSLMPLIYYCAYEGYTFDWDDLLSTTLTESITIVKESRPKHFHIFIWHHSYWTSCVWHINTRRWVGLQST